MGPGDPSYLTPIFIGAGATQAAARLNGSFSNEPADTPYPEMRMKRWPGCWSLSECPSSWVSY